jgi:dTDP-4-amino-4,6-dideoxygalactose transaminase
VLASGVLLDAEQLANVPEESLLAVVTSNMFGLPDDLCKIKAIARAKRAFVIDDAAQAFGGKRAGKWVGTGSHIGIYSLGRGKAVPTIEGALLVTNDEQLSVALQREFSALSDPGFLHVAALFGKMMIYAALLNPRLYLMPDAMPFLKLGTTEYDPKFSMGKLPALARELFRQVAGRTVQLNAQRSQKAEQMAELLAGSAFSVLRAASDSKPTFVRIPVLARNKSVRDAAVRMLRSHGLGATAFYPSAICDIPALSPHISCPSFHCPSAEDSAGRLFTIPSHEYVTERDLEEMADLLLRVNQDV